MIQIHPEIQSLSKQMNSVNVNIVGDTVYPVEFIKEILSMHNFSFNNIVLSSSYVSDKRNIF